MTVRLDLFAPREIDLDDEIKQMKKDVVRYFVRDIDLMEGCEPLVLQQAIEYSMMFKIPNFLHHFSENGFDSTKMETIFEQVSKIKDILVSDKRISNEVSFDPQKFFFDFVTTHSVKLGLVDVLDWAYTHKDRKRSCGYSLGKILKLAIEKTNVDVLRWACLKFGKHEILTINMAYDMASKPVHMLQFVKSEKGHIIFPFQHINAKILTKHGSVIKENFVTASNIRDDEYVSTKNKFYEVAFNAGEFETWEFLFQEFEDSIEKVITKDFLENEIKKQNLKFLSWYCRRPWNLVSTNFRSIMMFVVENDLEESFVWLISEFYFKLDKELFVYVIKCNACNIFWRIIREIMTIQVTKDAFYYIAQQYSAYVPGKRFGGNSNCTFIRKKYVPKKKKVFNDYLK